MVKERAKETRGVRETEARGRTASKAVRRLLRYLLKQCDDSDDDRANAEADARGQGRGRRQHAHHLESHIPCVHLMLLGGSYRPFSTTSQCRARANR